MLADATKTEMRKQGTDPSRPAAQMSGSTYGTLLRNILDKKVPPHPPTIPVTSVTAPNVRLHRKKYRTVNQQVNQKRTSAVDVMSDVWAVTLHLSTVGQEPWVHGGCSPRNTLALVRKVGTQKAKAPRSKFEAVIPSVDHT